MRAKLLLLALLVQTVMVHADCRVSSNVPLVDATSVLDLKIAAPLSGCTLADTCPGSGRNRLWAQQKTDADLVADPLAGFVDAQGKLPAQHATVGVVDSGFDVEGNSKNLARPLSRVERGFDLADEPNVDRIGHGTAVTSLIGGSAGVGVAADASISMYQATRSENSKPVEINEQSAIEKACADGNDVINVSIGGIGEEVGLPNQAQVGGLFGGEDKFLKSLEKRGCLVIKSAGNGGVKIALSSDPDDAILKVGALTGVGAAAAFSATGELDAPGDDVFVLESSGVASERRAVGANRCGRSEGRFVKGTSFSAPLATGVAAQVFGQLKTSAVFRALPGKDRIRLVNRVLRASVLSGSVNVLRALTIARIWTNLNSTEIPSAEDLASSLRQTPHAVCSKQPRQCSLESDCTAQVACVRANRMFFSLCETQDPAALVDTIEVLQKAGNLELAATLLERLNLLAPGTAVATPALAVAGGTDLVRLISYYALYKKVTGTADTVTETALREQALQQLLGENDFNARYNDSLLALLKSEQIYDIAFLEKLATSPKTNTDLLSAVIQAVRDDALSEADSTRILLAVLASAQMNEEVAGQFDYALKSGRLSAGTAEVVSAALKQWRLKEK